MKSGTDLGPDPSQIALTMPSMTNFKPEGYTSVAPWVVTDDTGAFLDFVTAPSAASSWPGSPSMTAPSAMRRSGSAIPLYSPSTDDPGGRRCHRCCECLFQMLTRPWPDPLSRFTRCHEGGDQRLGRSRRPRP